MSYGYGIESVHGGRSWRQTRGRSLVTISLVQRNRTSEKSFYRKLFRFRSAPAHADEPTGSTTPRRRRRPWLCRCAPPCSSRAFFGLCASGRRRKGQSRRLWPTFGRFRFGLKESRRADAILNWQWPARKVRLSLFWRASRAHRAIHFVPFAAHESGSRASRAITFRLDDAFARGARRFVPFGSDAAGASAGCARSGAGSADGFSRFAFIGARTWIGLA